jgi:hypothetical protein
MYLEGSIAGSTEVVLLLVKMLTLSKLTVQTND